MADEAFQKEVSAKILSLYEKEVDSYYMVTAMNKIAANERLMENAKILQAAFMQRLTAFDGILKSFHLTEDAARISKRIRDKYDIDLLD
jgi:hypothetical protein